MTDDTKAKFQPFDMRAAIDEYLSEKPDFNEVALDLFKQTADYVASGRLQDDALKSMADTVKRMREQPIDLNALLQSTARRAAQKNEDWIRADLRKRKALADGDTEAAAEEEQTQAEIDRNFRTGTGDRGFDRPISGVDRSISYDPGRDGSRPERC